MAIQEIPESYRDAVAHINSLTFLDLKKWLYAELRGKTDSGKTLNLIEKGDWRDPQMAALGIKINARYLYEGAVNYIKQSCIIFLREWIQTPDLYDTQFIKHILDLMSDLKIIEAKPILIAVVDSGKLDQIGFGYDSIFQAIAGISDREDQIFWIKIAKEYPKFGGLAFQVLWRIDRTLVLDLMPHLDFYLEGVRGSVMRCVRAGENKP